MLEMIVAAIAKLPTWLSMITDALLVIILFTFSIIFLWGMFVGIRIIGRRSNDIESITLIPFGIKFKSNDQQNN
jgi:hypothetical protein